jgi:electron-transferring-flavoprotein dehydrogenase
LPGISGNEILYGDEDQKVIGIRNGDMGIGKDGEMKDTFEPGIDIMAK